LLFPSKASTTLPRASSILALSNIAISSLICLPVLSPYIKSFPWASTSATIPYINIFICLKELLWESNIWSGLATCSPKLFKSNSTILVLLGVKISALLGKKAFIDEWKAITWG